MKGKAVSSNILLIKLIDDAQTKKSSSKTDVHWNEREHRLHLTSSFEKKAFSDVT